MKKISIKKKLLTFLLVTASAFGSDITLDELEKLRQQNLISTEDYMILKQELTNNSEEELYTLKINGSEVDNAYSVINENDIRYLELGNFLKSINIENFIKNEKINLTLGENLRKIEINLKNNEIYEKGTLLQEQGKTIIQKDEKVYLREDIFKKLFTSNYRLDENSLKLSIFLNFSPPEEVLKRLSLKAENLKENSNLGVLQYGSERQLFELGYARITANKIFTKQSDQKSFENTWDSSFEYQGGLLYGQLQFDYNIKDNILNDITLEYDDIWKNHTFKISNTGGNQGREWGISFYKDKGYYNDGSKVIIRENVPVGSRAELKYMGASIAIENEENGEVVFDNPIIVTDRTYTLIIYTPEGKVIEKIIKTTEDFDKQNKGEVQYTFLLNEDHDSKKYTTSFDTFYGVTDKLTLGAGYNRGIETINNKYQYTQDAKVNIVYGDTYNGLSYILRLDFEKSFDDYVVGNQKYKDKYSYGGLTQLGYGNLKYTYENTQYGKFHSEKYKENHAIQYDIFQNVRLTYDYNKTKKYLGESQSDNQYGISIDKNIGKILFSLDAKKSQREEDEYSLSAYYTTRTGLSTRLENKWTNSGKDYETILSIYNNNYRGFLDYSLEFGYSEQYKDKATFKISMKLADWLDMDASFDKTGSQEYKFGIDKIVDLKNPTKKVDSMDVSRVKVITFIDENNNNKLDSLEKLIEGVEVTIGNTTAITNEDGYAMFYGISNGVIYDLKPLIKKPSFTLGDNKITIKGNFASTIEAYVPVKPMLNLSGKINIDEGLNLTDLEKEELYQNVLIEIKDLNGKSIELVMPDNIGEFDVSGLFPEKYIIEVSYLGDKYNLQKLNDTIKLSYLEDEYENKIVYNLNAQKISKAN